MKFLTLARVLTAALVMHVAGTAPVLAAPWLFVSDVHLDPDSRNPQPAGIGKDTNAALLESAIREMQRVDPDPPVVVIPGDFLGHSIRPNETIPTVTLVAKRFDRAFPRAQFVIALGNEDSGCADYGVSRGSAFLRATAKAWEPLVDRHGAAPDFARTFPVDGSYTASLPLHGVRAVVIDDTVWSPRYRAACGPPIAHDVPLTELDHDLQRNAGRYWLVLHIPPGIDAYSTARFGHHLVVVPFLDPGSRETFEGIVDNPARHVEMVLAGHIHRYSYRILAAKSSDPIPLITVPAVSPIFGNEPGFLTADVGPNGTIVSTEEYSYIIKERKWRDMGGSRTLGLPSYTGQNLLALQRRLDGNPSLRERYAELYLGWTHPGEILPWTWPIYRCAAVAFSASTFRACEGTGGFSIFTTRGIVIVGIAAIVAIAVIVGGVVAICRAARKRTA